MVRNSREVAYVHVRGWVTDRGTANRSGPGDTGGTGNGEGHLMSSQIEVFCTCFFSFVLWKWKWPHRRRTWRKCACAESDDLFLLAAIVLGECMRGCPLLFLDLTRIGVVPGFFRLSIRSAAWQILGVTSQWCQKFTLKWNFLENGLLTRSKSRKSACRYGWQSVIIWGSFSEVCKELRSNSFLCLGLHRDQGEVCDLLAPHCWSLCRKALPQGTGTVWLMLEKILFMKPG